MKRQRQPRHGKSIRRRRETRHVLRWLQPTSQFTMFCGESDQSSPYLIMDKLIEEVHITSPYEWSVVNHTDRKRHIVATNVMLSFTPGYSATGADSDIFVSEILERFCKSCLPVKIEGKPFKCLPSIVSKKRENLWMKCHPKVGNTGMRWNIVQAHKWRSCGYPT